MSLNISFKLPESVESESVEPEFVESESVESKSVESESIEPKPVESVEPILWITNFQNIIQKYFPDFLQIQKILKIKKGQLSYDIKDFIKKKGGKWKNNYWELYNYSFGYLIYDLFHFFDMNESTHIISGKTYPFRNFFKLNHLKYCPKKKYWTIYNIDLNIFILNFINFCKDQLLI